MIAEVGDSKYGNPDIKMLEEAAYLLLKGEVLVCPTDTGYAFAANALDETAIRKVFALKKRSSDKPIHMAVRNIDEAVKYAYVDEAARTLAQRFLPGALTMVMLRREVVPSLLTGGRGTVGIRIPDNRIMLSLIEMAGRPLTTTSANLSGQATPYRVEEIISQLGDSIYEVSLILDQGMIPSQGTSTIVDLSIDPPQVLRQGLIGEDEIWEALGIKEVVK